MKPITNILLAVALVCYVFLPFYDIALQGGLNGFEFTAGLISRTGSVRGIVFALLPFIAGFLAIRLNCFKSKVWSAVSIVLIAAWLFFFYTASNFHEFALAHQPEVTPTDDLGEGFAIAGLGVGFISSCSVTAASLITAIISLMPFKFNEAIERAVDDTIDKGIEGSRKHIKALGDEVRDEWTKIESKAKKGKTAKAKTQQAPKQDDTVQPPALPPVEKDKEDDSRFMPGNNDA
ncbi:MAG: hypothetical protein KBT13_11390 [Bacteroidales bacterium]|nr:hypothetical protein [Candidatus Sodaliphilus limicaballi]